MAWIAAARVDDVKEGEILGVKIDGYSIALYRIVESFYATSNVCTHQVALLSDGYLEDDVIECPIHSALFHVPTGEVRCGPATEPLQTFATRIEGGSIMVEIPS